MPLEPSRGLMLYIKTLETAMEDGVVTEDESSMLNILSRSLNLPEGAAEEASMVIGGSMSNPIGEHMEEEWSRKHFGDATCYQSALIAALDNDIITTDEMAILDCLRRVMALQEDEHAMVEEAVRAMVRNSGDERIMDRLDSYLTTHPFR